MDIVGRVVGERFDPEKKTDKFVMRVTSFSIVPSIFFTWLERSARKISNHPDSLKTRIEGYYLNMGFHVPVIAKYNLRFDNVIQSDDDEEAIRETNKLKGDLYGFSIVISFTALLGV